MAQISWGIESGRSAISLVLFFLNVAGALQLAAPFSAPSAPNASSHPLLLNARQHGALQWRPDCGYDTRLMAECMELLYQTKANCGCWVKTKEFTVTRPSKIRVGFYQHGNECLVGISGHMNGAEQFNENPPRYFTRHDPILSEMLCDKATVRGFAMQAKQIFTNAHWTEYAAFLAGDNCHGGVTAIGTSYGGAMAEILAGCANQGRLSELQGTSLPTFHVSRLYTFGAPPTALSPIYNGQVHLKDGSSSCFQGQRVYLASEPDEGPVDLVAYSTAFNSYVHARQDAVQLIRKANGLFDVKIHPCRSYDTLLEPGWSTVFPVLAKIWNENAHQPFTALGKYVQQTHQMSVYVDSLNKVDDPAKLAHFMQDGSGSVVDGHEVMTVAPTQGKADKEDVIADSVRGIAARLANSTAR